MKTYTANLRDADRAASQANINAVEAFIRDHGSEYDRMSIQVLKESLMSAYLEEISEYEMDQYIFSNIKRIANL